MATFLSRLRALHTFALWLEHSPPFLLTHPQTCFPTNWGFWREHQSSLPDCFDLTLTFVNVRYRGKSFRGILWLLCFSVNQKWSERRDSHHHCPCPHLLSWGENPHLGAWLWVCDGRHLTPPQGAADTAAKCDWIKPPVIINCSQRETCSKKMAKAWENTSVTGAQKRRDVTAADNPA